MSTFFERNREELAARGIDLARVPPGQYVTERFPVLHAGVVPDVDLDEWDFVVDGLVDNPVALDWRQIEELPSESITADIHCVTKWSKLDTSWEGIPVRQVWDMVQPRPEATHVVIKAYHGFTANLPVADFIRPGNLFAHTYDGEPLELDHGYPLRLVVPHLYFWKSVKWVRGFTVVDADQPGFWERNGYHMYGDPFKEQRYWGD
ncbi:MAG: sulfite oxidase-like oxidoreductase [Acidimicrobiia bacterium]|nr:sulfite oxidase-like oxidoreductase [Acidimicrobiia bacterium]